MPEADKELGLIREALKILGLNEAAIEEQVIKLSELINKAIILRLCTEKKFDKSRLEKEDLEDIFKELYSPHETAKITSEEIEKIVADYFSAILEGVPEETVEKIRQLVNI